MTLMDYFLACAPELGAQWDPVHNTRLPETLKPASKYRAWWQCGQGHSWQASVHARVDLDTGCPYCAGRKPILGKTDLVTTHPDIALLWHESNPTRPESVVAGSHRKVLWRCREGHEWTAAVASVAVEGYGCPYCMGRKAIPGKTDLATVRPDIAAQWDSERNGQLKADQVLPSAHDKVWWKCELGHTWQAVVFSRTREKASGCPYCTGRKVLAGFNDLGTLKPKVAEEWHQPLNGALRPEDVTLGSNKAVWWQCSDGHVWRAVIYSRTRRKGAGCPVCAGVVKPPRAPAEKARRRTEPRRAAKTNQAMQMKAI